MTLTDYLPYNYRDDDDYRVFEYIETDSHVHSGVQYRLYTDGEVVVHVDNYDNLPAKWSESRKVLDRMIADGTIAEVH